MDILTSRLRIVPLSAAQLALLLEAKAAFEAEFGLTPSSGCLDQHEREAMRWLHDTALEHPDAFPWYARWHIIALAAKTAIGAACFKGPPNSDGEVELGYGIDPPHRNRGYMTEAAQALCEWAFGQAGVQSVVAITDRDNIASHTICRNCGMSLTGESPDGLVWRRRG